VAGKTEQIMNSGSSAALYTVNHICISC